MNTMTVSRGKGYNEEYAMLCGSSLYYWVDVSGSEDMDGHHEFGTKKEADELIIQLFPAPVCDVYQRADGAQIAVNAEGTTCFMRPFKQAAWLRAGFEANLEYFWKVEKGVTINNVRNEIITFQGGVLTTLSF